jgi:Fe-Mn family superoxide dismutase|tara:strand:+ start:1732 stop:2409 length:678 start_codon:yes stop_codon:yes gene_type:complete
MKNLFNGKIKNVIRDTLKIDESLSAQEKKFTFNSDFLSNENFQNHIELYQGYLENFNKVSAKLDTVDRQNVNCNHSEFRSLKLDEAFNMNGVFLHESYFANIGDVNSEIKMDSLAYMRLARDFGSFDAWQKDFIACASASQCGWAITYLNTYTQTYMNAVVDLHTNNIPFGSYPIIVMDAWQHAYYRDYLKDVTTYTRAMMKLLRWPVIEERIQKADKIIQVLRS